MSVTTPRRARLAALAAVAVLAVACARDQAGPPATGPSATGAAATGPGTAPGTAVPGPPPGTPPDTAPPAGVPALDHVVVVVEENRPADAILGNPDAPYLNELARRGATFTEAYAETHPSQPNYLALFSGSTQGVTDDTCPPPGSPFTTPNLAAQLGDAGRSFTGYAEGLPDRGRTVCSAGAYARKHAPWVDFAGLPPSTSQPFSAFPRDRGDDLPAVAFVIPDQDHDMHDGSIAEGDRWLRANLGGYVEWAASHRSILVVTWDEDDFSAVNHIATIAVGGPVRPGTYPERIDHYRLLRTIEAAHGLPGIGAAASAAPITSIWR